MKYLPESFNRLTEWLVKGGIDNLAKVKNITIDSDSLEYIIKLENNLSVYINTHSIDDCDCNIYFQYERDGKVYDLSCRQDWGFLSEMPNEFSEMKEFISSFLDGSLRDPFDKLEFINRAPNKGKIIQRLSYVSVMKGLKGGK
jgi:hypothetical protein